MVWHGDQSYQKKIVIDKDRKQRARIPDLRIHGERLKTLDINDVCQYLGNWGTGNGNMSATRQVVCDKQEWHAIYQKATR